MADSTYDSEYIASSEATIKATYLENFIGGLGVVLSIEDHMEIFYDNEGAVTLLRNLRIMGGQGTYSGNTTTSYKKWGMVTS